MIRAIFLSLFLFSINSQAQLVFETGKLEEVFQKAKTENKSVFLFIYADGCPHCDEFKKTFQSMTSGANFYNKNFINAKVEVNSDEGKEVRFKWGLNVMSTPLCTFWSGDTTLLSFEPSTDQLNTETAILEMGKNALDPKKHWKTEKTTFNQLTDIGSLAKLAFKARIAQDTVMNLAVLDRYVAVKGKNNLSVRDYMLIKQAAMDVDSPLFSYLINNKAAFVQAHGQKDVYGTIENIVMFSLMSSKAESFDSGKIEYLKTLLRSIGISEQTVKARFLLYETNKFFAKEENDKATALFLSYYEGATSVHPNEAAFIKKHFKEKTGNSELPTDLKKLIESKLQKTAN